jgi:hypothetical protein
MAKAKDSEDEGATAQLWMLKKNEEEDASLWKPFDGFKRRMFRKRTSGSHRSKFICNHRVLGTNRR